MNIKKIVSGLSVLAFVLFGALAPISSYAADPLLTCAPAQSSVIPGQRITFKATGGNGVYTWSAPQMNTQTGSELTVYYPYSGASSVTVSSNGQTANCFVNIIDPVLGDTTLSCGQPTRNVAVNAVTTFTATGGDGNYVWTAPQMSPRTGNTLSVTYPTNGTSSVTVTSAGVSTTCVVNIGTGAPATPSLPNTGLGGASSALLLNMGMVLGLSGITALFVNKKIKKVN